MTNIKSTYIHIPFCTQMCHYCSFVKFYYAENKATEYLRALKKEMDIYLPGTNHEINTIYIGGGTPTALNVEQLRILMEIIHSKFDIANVKEFTIEINPGDVNHEKLYILQAYGINRISFGVQVMDDAMLESLGRKHRVKDVYQTVDLLTKYDFTNISLDLIYALPQQTVEQFSQSLYEALEFQLPHYSTYALQIEPKTLFYHQYKKGLLHRPKEEEEVAMYGILKQAMGQNNIEQYEISNFAKPGYESKHNLTYWNNDYYYGFGAGASGYLPGRRIMNVKPLGVYMEKVKKDEKPIAEVDEISLKEKIEEELILGLRKIKGYDENIFHKRFGFQLDELYGESLVKLQNKGLLKKERNLWKLTDDGMLLANHVFTEFILEEHQLLPLNRA